MAKRIKHSTFGQYVANEPTKLQTTVQNCLQEDSWDYYTTIPESTRNVLAAIQAELNRHGKILKLLALVEGVYCAFAIAKRVHRAYKWIFLQHNTDGVTGINIFGSRESMEKSTPVSDKFFSIIYSRQLDSILAECVREDSDGYSQLAPESTDDTVLFLRQKLAELGKMLQQLDSNDHRYIVFGIANNGCNPYKWIAIAANRETDTRIRISGRKDIMEAFIKFDEQFFCAACQKLVI